MGTVSEEEIGRAVVLVGTVMFLLLTGTAEVSPSADRALDSILPPVGAGNNLVPIEEAPPLASDAVPKSFALGTYLICDQWQSLCNYTEGVDTIRAIGGSVVLLPVGGDEVFYPSSYLPKPDWMPDNHIKEVVQYAHSRGLKVYAWLAMPHGYWLADNRHPEWISILSNGTPTDRLGEGYFFRIVPPSRVLSTPEYLDQLKGVVGELVDLGFDGIDINDNFQFVYDSSFDNFTVDKFQQDTGISVFGDTIPERARSIKDNRTILDSWYAWRAGQVTKLLGLMQQYIRDAGSGIPLRPHLMSGPFGYWDWGYDWGGISEVVDVPYLMLGFGEENVTEPVSRLVSAGAKAIATSLYLFDMEIGDEEKLGQNLAWVRDAGASELFLFTYLLAEEKGLWDTLRRAVDIANQSSIPSLTVGHPQHRSAPTYVTPSTEFNLSRKDGTARAGSVRYRIDADAWTQYTGNFTVNRTGPHTIYYYATDTIGCNETIRSFAVFVDDDIPTSILTVGQPRYGSSPIYVRSFTEINLSATDDGSGVASIRYRLDAGVWTEYTGNFGLTEPGSHAIEYYATDNLGQSEPGKLFDVFVDEYAPTIAVSPEVGEPGILEIKAGERVTLISSDLGVGGEVIYYSLDDGVTWHQYTSSIVVGADITIRYYAADALGNRGPEEQLTVVVAGSERGPVGNPAVTGILAGITGAILTMVLVWIVGRRKEE